MYVIQPLHVAASRLEDLFEKRADDGTLATVPPKAEEWSRTIQSALVRHAPWLGKYSSDVDITDHDDSGKNGRAFVTVIPKIVGATPAAALTRARIRIPIIISKGKMMIPYVFECQNKFYGLNERRIQELLSDPSITEAPENPRNLHTSLSNHIPPRPFGNAGMVGGMLPGSTYGYGGSVHTASDPACSGISHAISGTATDRELDAYGRAWSAGLDKFATQEVEDSLRRLLVPLPTREQITEHVRKEASRQALRTVQVRPSGRGYLIKWADGESYAPQQMEVSAPQAQATLPPEMLAHADAMGSATITEDPTTPDTEEEDLAPVTGFGMYRCIRADTGEQVDGYVLPNLFDPETHAPSQMSLFYNGTAYDITPNQIHGSLLAVATSLPSAQRPLGLGVFYRMDGRKVYATLPVTIQGSVTMDGKTGYDAIDHRGQPLQVEMSPGILQPVLQPGMDPAERGTLYMPSGFKFLPLSNRVRVVSMPPPPPPPPPQMLMPAVSAPPPQPEQAQAQPAQAQPAAKMSSQRLRVKTASSLAERVHIRVHKNQVELTGGAVRKVASGWMPVDDALFLMGVIGIQENVARPLLKEAESRKHVGLALANVRPIIPAEEVIAASAAKLASAPTVYGRGWGGSSPLFLKEAIALSFGQDRKAPGAVDGGAVDSLLSLGFLNDENVGSFHQRLPELERASSSVAAMVYAIQLGYQGVPLAAAVRALLGLDSVIQSLKRIAPTRAV